MTTGPKWSRGALEIINNTYAVRNGLLYEYYPISVKDHTENDKFIRLEISPGVMIPGVAIIGRQFYDVSLGDLYRRKINVEKRHVHTADDNVGKRRSRKARPEQERTRKYTDEQRVSELFGDEVGEAADMAWENQVDSLLQTVYSKEGEDFEITSTAQSRRTNESSTVPDLLTNTG